MHNVLHFSSKFFEDGDDVLPNDLSLLAVVVGDAVHELAGLGVGGPLRGYVGKGGVGWDDSDV